MIFLQFLLIVNKSVQFEVRLVCLAFAKHIYPSVSSREQIASHELCGFCMEIVWYYHREHHSDRYH
jgi:hypothetical protein